MLGKLNYFERIVYYFCSISVASQTTRWSLSHGDLDDIYGVVLGFFFQNRRDSRKIERRWISSGFLFVCTYNLSYPERSVYCSLSMVVSYAAVICVVTQHFSPLTAA